MNTPAKNSAAILKVLSLTGLLISAPAGAVTLSLAPVADATVASDSPTTNFGSDPVLSTGRTTSGNTLHLWTSLLRFDLSGIPDNLSITGATLHMYQVNGAGLLISGTDISHVADDTWAENTVTWSNQPNTGNLLGTNPDDRTHRGWSQWDLLETGLWNSSDDLTDNALSLAITESGGNSTHNWCSKDSDLTNCLVAGETVPISSLRQPYLEVSYVPLPAAAWLFASGLVLLGWKARRTA